MNRRHLSWRRNRAEAFGGNFFVLRGSPPYPFRPFPVIMIGGQDRFMTELEFQAIFERHKDAVYRYAWRMTGSPSAAEDIAQEAFLVLLRFPGRFESGRGEMRSFLLGVARNLVGKRWRDQDRWDSLEDELFVAQPMDIVSLETTEMVGTAIRALPPLQREVLVLTQFEGLTLDEAALTVGAEVGTVKARLHRARQNLKRMLAPLRESEGRIPINGTAR